MCGADGDIPVDDVRGEDPLAIQGQAFAVCPRHDLRQRPHRLDGAAVVLRVQIVGQSPGEAGDRLPVLSAEGLRDVGVDAATRQLGGVLDAESSGSAVWAC